MAKKEQRIIVIVGPTSSGKSAFAVDIARAIDGEVISADSRQVYRGLDIGTGKVTKREMRSVPHHLLDVANPSNQFTAHEFVTLATKSTIMIYHNDRVPIVCGGTGFYIDALLGRVKLSYVPANPALRRRLEKKTPKELLYLLKEKDSARAKNIDGHNKRRLIRALEIAYSQQGIGKHTVTRKNAPLSYKATWIGIRPDADILRTRINLRLAQRLRRGMIAEARRLHARGLSYKRMHELGLEYRSLARFLQGKITRAEMERELQAAIWHYAKRQLTYWRRNKDIQWFSADPDVNTIVKLLRT